MAHHDFSEELRIERGILPGFYPVGIFLEVWVKIARDHGIERGSFFQRSELATCGLQKCQSKYRFAVRPENTQEIEEGGP